MLNRNPIASATLTALAIACVGNALAADAAPAAAMASAKNIGDQKFTAFPDVPTCMQGVVLSGDPDKGPSLILAKTTGHCLIPWHWHSSNEHVMLSGGIGKLEMKDAKPVTLKSGAYGFMPAKHPHQFTCISNCVIFLSSDGVFDTHYIDKDGKEIPSAQALKKK